MEYLRNKFNENFKVNHLCLDLMYLIDEIDMTCEVLDNFIIEQFNNNFTYGELYDLFKSDMNKEDLQELLETMGHDFIDLDELSEEKKQKFY